MRTLVVDGMNVIGSRPDGWWRDRAGAKRRLFRALAALHRAEGRAVAVVFDGRPLPDLPEEAAEGVGVFYARRPGRNAADDRIVELVEAHAEPARLEVVTADRDLRARVEAAGATVSSPRTLLDRLDALAAPD